MRRRTLLVAGTIGALALTGAAGALAAARTGGEDTQQGAGHETATVERTTLSAGLTVSGQLGYGTPTQVPGTGKGVVTALPAAGDVVPTGQVLYAVDGRPVLTLHGSTPLWRDLALGDTGPDVLALREALAALGYQAGDASSDRFDEPLADALGALYRDRGYPEPKDLPGTSAAREEAEQAAATARAELAQAQAALAEKTSGPTAGEQARAEAAVAAAQRALDAATAAEQASEQAAAEGSDTTDGTVQSVAEATEQLRTAQAELADLGETADATAERAQVAAARTALEAAEQKVAAAGTNGVRSGEIVMVPADAVRIDTVPAVLGQTAAETVLTWTGTSVRGYADLTTSQAQQVATGTEVDLTLPDSTTVAGTVAAVEPARTGEDGLETGPTLVVDLPDQEALADVGLPAVKITLPAQEADDALVVPVTALLALAEGGYALEVVNPGEPARTTLVPVEVGLVADARAQVITEDVDEGAQVVVP